MKKLSNERREELVKMLKSYFKKDSTAFCSLKSVSSSGGYRHIQILASKKNKIYNLSYEKLTENQEEETRKLLEYCELEWDQNCINFHENTTAVKTISSRQVKNKMYQGSSEVWKKHWAYIQPLINALENY